MAQPKPRIILRPQPKIGSNNTQPKGNAGPKPSPNGKPVAMKPMPISTQTSSQ